MSDACVPPLYVLHFPRNRFSLPIITSATNMLRMEPTSAACLEQVAKGSPEGSARLYAELEDCLKIFDKGNHSMVKGLEEVHHSRVTLHHETRTPSWRAPALRCDNRG
ncbi:unnamed protein product [Ectocarpus sp. 6 AP-2014]